ncbi:MAG: efflux RND transporter periplasmic adaptor subunit [Acidobacteriota bacterium]
MFLSFRFPVVFLLVLPLTLTACSETSEDQGPSAPVPTIEALIARSGSLPLVERLHGVVAADNQVEVRSEMAGRVVDVMVDSGASVERGRPLIRLDDTIAKQRLRQAEASLQLARAAADEADARQTEVSVQVVRSRRLAEQALISPLDLETQEARLAAAAAAANQASARVDEARATLAERQYDLDQTVVRAPTDGRVGRRQLEVGARVDPSTLLFRIGDLERMTVDVTLADTMLDHLQVGQTVLVHLEDDTPPLRATLTRISPFLDQGSFSTVGEIDVDNADGRLRPGMFVGVDVLYGESATATLVPTSVLWDDPRDGVLGVFVVDGPKAAGAARGDEASEPVHGLTWRPVAVLAEGRGTVGVGGVEEGEWVVSLGQHLLPREAAAAHVREVEWDHVLDLQALQREDLLAGFLAEQRRTASVLGADLPSNADFFGARGGER